jgi:hypothetical protein
MTIMRVLTRPSTYPASVVLLLVLGACAGDEDAAPGASRGLGTIDTLSASTNVGTAPMVAVSRQGREAVAWVSAPGGGTDGRLYVSVDGATPAEVRDTLGGIEPHGESPPKLAFSPDGALNAIYVVPKIVPGRRFPAAALRFARSEDGGRTWGAPVTVTDDSLFASHNFHALHAGADGALYVAWLDGREGKSAAFITRSTDGGRTWSRNVRASTGEACPCCRTALATARDGTLYLAWRTVMPGDIRDIVVARSADGGRSWSDEGRVHADDWVFPGCPHAGPTLQVDSTGALHVAWWTGKEGKAGVYYARSTDGARTFSPAIPLGVASFSRAAHVQMALAGPSTVAVAWDDGTRDIPAILLRVSRDSGATFADAVELSQPGVRATFPVVTASDSAVMVAWSQTVPKPADTAATPAGMPATATLHPVGNARVLVRRMRLH